MKSSTKAAAQLGELNNKKGNEMSVEKIKDLDVTNINMVSVNGSSVVILNPPRGPITKEHALTLAAWIVTLACANPGEFEKYLDAVQST